MEDEKREEGESTAERGAEFYGGDQDAEPSGGVDELVGEGEEKGDKETEEAGESDKPPTGIPEPPGRDPGDISGGRSPHASLSNPARDPDPTEWPDPYDKRDDPKGPPPLDRQATGEEPHTPTGSTSTSEPHPSQDPEARDRWEGPKRDKVDD